MSASPRSAFSITVLAAVLGLTASACSGQESSQPSKADIDLQVSTPAADGEVETLHWTLPDGEPTSIDPALVGDYSPAAVSSNLCEGLMRLNEDFELEPGLAEKVTKPDDTTMVFDLRPGVTFTNGDPLTPEDVVYSLERNLDPDLGSFWSAYYGSVKDIEKTGPEEVTVTFTQPDSLFEQEMAIAGGAISQKSYVEEAGDTYGSPKGGVMCTGPFSLESWEPGERIVLSANDDYWDEALVPKVRSVEFEFISDPNTIAAALQSGDIDGTYEVPLSIQDTLATSDAGTLYAGPSTQVVELLPTEDEGPMQDVNLRKALDLAIDKTALAEAVMGGAAQPLRAFIPPFAWGEGPQREILEAGYDGLDDTTTPDVEAAKKLVEESGATDLDVVIAISADDEAGKRVLTFVQAAAKEVGLDVTIDQVQPTEFSGMFYDESARDGVDALYAMGYIELPNPLHYATYFVEPDGLFNWIGYDDPKTLELYDSALQATDPEEAAKLFVEAQARYSPERIAIPLVSPYERLFMNKRISGAPSSFAYINMPWAAMIGGTE